MTATVSVPAQQAQPKPPPNRQQQRPAAATELSGQQLLEEILKRPMSERHRALDMALADRVPKIEELLPDFMKGQGERLAKRAMMTFARTPDLQSCPPADFVRCVLEAAEMGFAIDGKMCYVVKYKSKYQCQLDYKGIVAVARRMKTIKDIYGDVVGENDHFIHRRHNGDSVLDHTYNLGKPRGEIIGAYCVVKLPDGEWRYELMARDELDRIQDRSPAKNGPWSTDINEMRKKTVFRRCLKLYGDDPGLIRVLELTDDVDSDEDAKPKLLAELTAALTGTGQRPPRNEHSPARNSLAAGEIPIDTPDEPDPLLIENATSGFLACDSLGEVDLFEAECDGRAKTDAERAAIGGMAEEARERVRSTRGTRSNDRAN